MAAGAGADDELLSLLLLLLLLLSEMPIPSIPFRTDDESAIFIYDYDGSGNIIYGYGIIFARCIVVIDRVDLVARPSMFDLRWAVSHREYFSREC